MYTLLLAPLKSTIPPFRSKRMRISCFGQNTTVHNRIYQSQVGPLLDNLENVANGERHLNPESPLNVQTCELHIIRYGDRNEWIDSIKRAKEFGYTVAAGWRIGVAENSREDLFTRVWWHRHAIEVQRTINQTGVRDLMYDNENYSGTAGQVRGDADDYVKMLDVARPYLEVLNNHDLRVHIHPVFADRQYLFSDLHFNNGIRGTAQCYDHRQQRNYWIDAEAYEARRRSLIEEHFHLNRRWPQVQVGYFQNDTVLRQPFYRFHYRFASSDGISCVDDQYKVDYWSMGTESFETLSAYGHEGLLHVYQPTGVREWDNDPVAGHPVRDRLLPLGHNLQDVSYVIPKWPSTDRWVHGKGNRPVPEEWKSSPWAPNYRPPVLHLIKGTSDDWSQVTTVGGAWVGTPTSPDFRFCQWGIFYSHDTATTTFKIVNTTDQVFTLTIADTSFDPDDEPAFGLFAGSDGTFKVFVDDTVVEGTYTGDLHEQTHAARGDAAFDLTEYSIWDRFTHQTRHFPYLW